MRLSNEVGSSEERDGLTILIKLILTAGINDQISKNT
jgi:hypothetical protein